MSRINVILTTYNGERFLREQIDSLLAQDNDKFRILAFDDGSTDGTLDILESYAKKYPEKIFVNKNKKNLGAGKNFLNAVSLINRASRENNEYFMFCDQDDVWRPNKISVTLKRMRQMEKRYGAGAPLLVYTDAVVVNDSLDTICGSFFEISKLEPKKHSLNSLLMENKCIGCTAMLNKPLASLITVIPENARYHDWWTALTAASFGHISYLPEKTLLYRQHGGNVVGGDSFGKYVKDRVGEVKELRERLNDTYAQAEEFLDIFMDDLPKKALDTVSVFTSLPSMNPLKRRATAIKYGFLKSGSVRNAGLMLVI